MRSWSCGWLWIGTFAKGVSLEPQFFPQKTSHQMFEHMYGVLNEVYLQNFFNG